MRCLPTVLLALLLSGCIPDHGGFDLAAYAEPKAPRYAASASVDDSGAIQAAIDAAVSDGLGEFVLPKGVYRVDSQLRWDVSRSGINWNGSTLDFSHMAPGVAMVCYTTDGDINNHPLSHIIHPFRNGRFMGPPKGGGVIGLSFEWFGYSISNVSIQNCGFTGFDTAVVMNSGCFDMSFTNVNFGSIAGRPMGRGVLMEAGSVNAGERISFSHCQFYNIHGTAYESNGGASPTFCGSTTSVSSAGTSSRAPSSWPSSSASAQL